MDEHHDEHRTAFAVRDDTPGHGPSVFERVSRVRRGRTQVPEHAVFLVPGLLGFDSIATFTYFAERVVAALRASLEVVAEQPVPVVALSIPPTAALRERQRRLVVSLADRLDVLTSGSRPLRVHLVGHSSGGLDANLLLRDAPLGPAGMRWSDLDPRAPQVRERIDSITSIASPHQGACFARDPLARLVGEHDIRGVPTALHFVLKLLMSTRGDGAVQDFLASRVRELGNLRLWDIAVRRWPLLGDLDPACVPPPVTPERCVLRRSFVTVAGHTTSSWCSSVGPDRLFNDLALRASGVSTGCSDEGPLVAASVARLQRAASQEAGELVIKAHGVELPERFDATCNDGFVNTARQLMDPSDADELGGIVVADHLDVVGHYDRTMWTLDADGHEHTTNVVSGLLHSGCGFADQQFFELYRRVARVIASAMH